MLHGAGTTYTSLEGEKRAGEKKIMRVKISYRDIIKIDESTNPVKYKNKDLKIK